MYLEDELPYSLKDPESIESYAQNLIGKKAHQALGNMIIKEGNKGGLGQVIEEQYFYLKNNSDSEPDFKEAGVELKVTPLKKNKNGTYSAKERLVLNIINYIEVYKEEFETSSFLKKNSLILLIYYLYEEELYISEYVIKFAQLFQFPEKDLKIIRDDWNTIVNKIKEGKAHEISEADTNYLAACTKGANKYSKRKQPFSDIMAQQRAFSLKQSYMTSILNEYLLQGKKTYADSLIKDTGELKNRTFEDFVLGKISQYAGMSVGDLAKMFSVEGNPEAKNYASMVADSIILNILGVQSDKIEEFEKANIKIKSIRIDKTDKIKEHMSFPTFKFKEIINEVWETSTLREMFLNTRFLFVIYRFDSNDVLRLEKGMFWNMSYNNLENDVKKVWKQTVETIKSGIKIIKKSGNREFNNLPNPSANRVSHVRPHAQNKNDTYPLPTGGEFPKQCFWLNNSYILEQVTGK